MFLFFIEKEGDKSKSVTIYSRILEFIHSISGNED